MLFPQIIYTIQQRGVAKDSLGDEEGACKDFKQAFELGDKDSKENFEKHGI